jgi:hypothetical protein
MKRSRKVLACVVGAVALVGAATAPSFGRDRPFGTARMFVRIKPPAIMGTSPVDSGQTGGGFSKVDIERFRCSSAGVPTATVDLSCNTQKYGQDWAPDNELAVAVDPENPQHIVAGSNDYFYRFNNSTGARQAIVPTGFFTSFDGGQTWVDGQIPMRSGNGAGDPAPAFDAKHDVVLMAQLENTGGLSGPWVSQGDISVSRSTNGGLRWSEPITVMQGTGAGIGPSNNAVFYDKEWLTVDNNPGSPFYGRAYVTATRFLNGRFGSYAESPIYLSYSDDGGRTWSTPKEISKSHPSCTYQETDGITECDEDQFSIPEVAPDGTLYVHFQNFQNEAAWEAPEDFDSQIMVVRSTNGGSTFQGPWQAAQLEDGTSDMPFSVIGRQTVWGHQIRWTSAGNVTVDPSDRSHLTVVWSDRGTPNPFVAGTANDDCIEEEPEAPDYDPCRAGPGSDISIYKSESFDRGQTWTERTLVNAAGGRHQWFPWADQKSDGTLVVGWDEDDQQPVGAVPANDTFHHVLWTEGAGKETLGAAEHIDVSVTHWSGQYVPRDDWPVVCGPVGYNDPGTPEPTDMGKDCNQFHGDYTGLQVDSRDRVHVVWTGLNRFETSPQIDPYTGERHDGYAQDAMYARR